jgi:DNA-directed RNA polymerase specialized sigma24 family protein
MSRGFPRTRWSLIAAASAKGDNRRAISELYALYFASIQRFVRSSGRALRDAQDVTQSVFARLLQPGELARANRERGAFHSWLALVIRSVMSSERRRARAQKRGGRAIVLSLDACAADNRHEVEPTTPDTPERAHTRHEREALCRRVMLELERWYASRGQHAQFRRLLPFLDGRDPPYEALARELLVPAATLRKQVFAMRSRYRELVWMDFRRRGVKPGDIEREILNLLDE